MPAGSDGFLRGRLPPIMRSRKATSERYSFSAVCNLAAIQIYGKAG
jgi:hypothetical protein